MPGVFDLYLLGGEQSTWRTVLADNEVSAVGVSFAALERRMPKKGIDVASWGFDKVLLDSGGHAANKPISEKNPGRTVGEWRAYSDAYQRCVEANAEHLEMVTEFDCEALGPEWVAEQRRSFYDHLDAEQFLPIWHANEGLRSLEALAERYPRIAIHESAFTGPTNIAARLNALARKGTWLHAVGLAQPQVLRQVEFSSAATTSWLSPTRFGETLVWDGTRLVRYPAKMKASARRRIRPLVERAGLDPDRIEADDKSEVTRLALHAWGEVEADTRRFRRNSDDVERTPLKSGTGGETVGTVDPEMRNDVPTSTEVTVPTPREREVTTLPVLGLATVQTFDKEAGATVEKSVMRVQTRTQRTCNECFVRDRCPAMAADSACAYDIPIEVKSPEQRRALTDGLLQMQAQRVAFLRYAEELSGGYADPNLSQEIDRLLKTLSTIADLEDNRDIFRLQVEARGKSGALSRIFGGDAVATLTSAVTGQQVDKEGVDGVMDRVIEGQKVTARR